MPATTEDGVFELLFLHLVVQVRRLFFRSTCLLSESCLCPPLTLHFSLQMFSNTEEVLSVKDDLLQAYEQLHTASKKQKKKEKLRPSTAVEGVEEAVDPMAVLVEILLSFLSQPSAMMRHLVDRVFRVFCGSLDLNALSLLLEVIEREDSSLEAKDGSEDEDEVDMDVDATDSVGHEYSEEEEDAEEDYEEEEDEDEDEDDTIVDEELRRNLSHVLQVAGDDEAEGSSELSEWDDDRCVSKQKGWLYVSRLRACAAGVWSDHNGMSPS